MKIAIASGKGGTGKTTISVNLACVADEEVQLVDCDVEEPNAHLFLRTGTVLSEIEGILIPQIDDKLCNGCGECASFCEFNALAALGGAPMVFPELCHGCGGCARVCSQGAITEVEHRIGTVDSSICGSIQLVGGCMDVGVAMAPPLIKALKKRVHKQGLVILDAPPGTNCPVIAALGDVDYVVLVTEPTPFGLNDLKLAVALVRTLNLPFGVVINRADSGNDNVVSYCRSEQIDVLMELPDDRRIAQVYSRGEVIVKSLPEYKSAFKGLLKKIVENCAAAKEELI